MDYQLLSKWMINLYQTGLSTTIQMDLSAAIEMDDQPLSNRIINLHPNGLSAAIQMDYQLLIPGGWSILLSNMMINHLPNGLSAANPFGWWLIILYQIEVDQPPSKWISSWLIQMDDQPLSNRVINLTIHLDGDWSSYLIHMDYQPSMESGLSIHLTLVVDNPVW